MSFKAARKSGPWLFVFGLLLLGAGYLLGRGGLGPEGGARRAEKNEAARGSPGREPSREGAPSSGESGPPARSAPDREAAAQDEKGIVRFEGEGLRLAHLQIEPVHAGSVPSRLLVTGTVEPNLAGVVRVTPRVAGKITTVRVDVGDTVRAGQPLATLTSTDLAQAQAAYRLAAARVAIAGIDLQRQQKLARLGAFGKPTIEAARNQATTAQAEVDTARSEVDVARAGIAEAESQVHSLQAALEQARTGVKVTQSRFNRADLLLKEGIVSQQAWEQAQAEYQHSQADVDAARANITQGVAKLETARANLEAAQAKRGAATERRQIAAQALSREEAVYRGRYLTSKEMAAAEATWRQAQLDQRAAAANIRLLGGAPAGSDTVIVRAPLGGRVTERLVTLGEMVTPDRSLFTLMNLSTVWVQLSVYPQDVAVVRVGQGVTVTSETAPGRTFSGAVSSISDVVDAATRTVKVRCVIRNAGSLLKPQTFARGTIAVGARGERLLAPKDAVQRMEGKTVVFMPADTPGEFRAQPVAVGADRGSQVEIRSGLAAGQRIVTHNAFLVKAQAMKGALGDEDQSPDKGAER